MSVYVKKVLIQMVKTLIESCKGFDGTVKQPPVQWRNHCSVVDMCMQQVLNNRWTGENTSWQLPFCMKPFHWWVHCIPRQPLPFKNTSDCQKLLSELKTVPICSRTSLSCRRNLKKSVMTWMLVKFFLLLLNHHIHHHLTLQTSKVKGNRPPYFVWSVWGKLEQSGLGQ